MREPVPLRERPVDIALVVFFVINLLFITYLIDIEQLTVPSTENFDYPVWPPSFIVDLVHWYGRNYDPLLMERPVWWKVTIWWDQLYFGPFYALAIYAFTTGKDWIRIPSIIYASVILTILSIILSEEVFGSHATGSVAFVLACNAPWVIMPLILLLRMVASERPFTQEFGAGRERA